MRINDLDFAKQCMKRERHPSHYTQNPENDSVKIAETSFSAGAAIRNTPVSDDPKRSFPFAIVRTNLYIRGFFIQSPLTHMSPKADAANQQPKPQSLSRKAGIMVVSRAVSITAQILAIITLTRRLSMQDFSLLSFLLLAYSTVLTLGQLGLPDSVFYFFEKVGAASRKAFALLTARLLFLVSLGGAAILFIIELVAPATGRNLDGLLLPFMLLVLLELPTIPMANVLIAVNRTTAAGFFNIFVGITQFLALVLPVFLGYSVAHIVYGLLVYGILRFLLSLFLFAQSFGAEQTGDLPKGMTRTLFAYAIPLSIAVTIWGLNRQIDKFIVEWFLDDITFAKYVIGAWEIPFLPTIAYSVAAVMMPQLVAFFLKDDKSQMLDLWLRGIRKVTVLLLPLVGVFLVTAEEFMVLFFSAKYAESALPFRIYTVIIIHRVASYSAILRAIDETKTITYSAIYLLALNILLSVPFVLLLGMAGPPLATLIASFLTWGYVLHKIMAKLDVRLTEVFPVQFYLKTMATASLAAIPMLFVKYNMTLPNGLMFAVLAIGYLLTYSILASVFGVIQKEDWRRLTSALRLTSA